MNQKQIKKLIDSILNEIGLGSELASELVFLTGLVESRYEYIRQLGDGPAFSPWRVELAEKIASVLMIRSDVLLNPKKEELKNLLWMNIASGIVFCRLKYRRVPKPLPSGVEECAKYWKRWYNSDLGKGTVSHFMELAELRKDK